MRKPISAPWGWSLSGQGKPHRSFMLTLLTSNKKPEHQRSGELPWLATFTPFFKHHCWENKVHVGHVEAWS